MRERPPEFRINYESPLWPGLQFSFLGPNGSFVNGCAAELSPYRAVGSKRASWVWVPEISRLAVLMPVWGYYVKFPNVLYLPQPGPKSMCLIGRPNRADPRFVLYSDGTENCGWVFWAYNGILRYSFLPVQHHQLTEVPYVQGSTYFVFLTLTGNYGNLRALISKDYAQPVLATRTFATAMKPAPNALHLGMRHATSHNYEGWLADVLIWNVVLPDTIGYELADPSNVDLRVGNVPLILPPRRRFWPVAVAEAPPAVRIFSRRQFGPRIGTRQVQV